MSQIKCIHGGGPACTRHGGDGRTIHGSTYVHTKLARKEMLPYTTQILQKSDPEKVHKCHALEGGFIDNEVAKSLLSHESFLEPMSKALYYFDLTSPEGTARLMELLPVLADDIIAEVYEEIWPGYPTDDESTFNIRIARSEIKGYLLDYLHNNEVDANAETERAVPSHLEGRPAEDIEKPVGDEAALAVDSGAGEAEAPDTGDEQ